MSIERGTLFGGFKVGEDWTEVLTFRAAGVPFVWTGYGEVKATLRYPDGGEAFTLSTTAGTIALAAGGVMTLFVGRAVSADVRPGQLTGDLLTVDAASRSLYYLDIQLDVTPRSTTR